MAGPGGSGLPVSGYIGKMKLPPQMMKSTPLETISRFLGMSSMRRSEIADTISYGRFLDEKEKKAIAVLKDPESSPSDIKVAIDVLTRTMTERQKEQLFKGKPEVSLMVKGLVK